MSDARARILEFDGRTDSVTGWARVLGIKRSTLSARLAKGESLVEIEATRGRPRGRPPSKSSAINRLPYEEDPVAQRFVAEHPDGATLDELAEVFGLTREGTRQLEIQALRRLRMRLALGFGDLVR